MGNIARLEIETNNGTEFFKDVKDKRSFARVQSLDSQTIRRNSTY